MLIDFGLAQNLSGPKIKYTFKGTPYFASNNALVRGCKFPFHNLFLEVGPKDDLESLIYILIYFIFGSLPWAKNVPVLKEDIQSHMEVQAVVHARNPDQLCADLEPEFCEILKYL